MAAWRAAFAAPDAFFGLFQLSTWCVGGNASYHNRTVTGGESLAAHRQQQLVPLTGLRDAWATNADMGDGCNIHPPWRMYAAARLARAALHIVYTAGGAAAAAWRSPSFASAAQPAGAPLGAVAVALRDVTPAGLVLRAPFNARAFPAANCSLPTTDAGICGFAALQFDGGAWVNASVELSADAQGLVLRAPPPPGSAAVTGSAYGWGAIPFFTAYRADADLPVLAWNSSYVPY